MNRREFLTSLGILLLGGISGYILSQLFSREKEITKATTVYKTETTTETTKTTLKTTVYETKTETKTTTVYIPKIEEVKLTKYYSSENSSILLYFEIKAKSG